MTTTTLHETKPIKLSPQHTQLLFGPSILLLSSTSILIVYNNASSLHVIDLRQLLLLLRLSQAAGVIICIRDTIVYLKFKAESLVLNDVLSSYLSPVLQGCYSIMGLYAIPITCEQRKDLIRGVTEYCSRGNAVDFSAECGALLEPGGYMKYLCGDKPQSREAVTKSYDGVDGHTEQSSTASLSDSCSTNSKIEIEVVSPSVEKEKQSPLKTPYEALSELGTGDFVKDDFFSIKETIGDVCKEWLQEKLPSEKTLKTIRILSSIALAFQIKRSKSARRIATNTIQATLFFSLVGSILGGQVLSYVRQASRGNSTYERKRTVTSIFNVDVLRLVEAGMSQFDSISSFTTLGNHSRKVKNICMMMFAFYVLKHKSIIKRMIFGNDRPR